MSDGVKWREIDRKKGSVPFLLVAWLVGWEEQEKQPKMGFSAERQSIIDMGWDMRQIQQGKEEENSKNDFHDAKTENYFLLRLSCFFELSSTVRIEEITLRLQIEKGKRKKGKREILIFLISWKPMGRRIREGGSVEWCRFAGKVIRICTE